MDDAAPAIPIKGPPGAALDAARAWARQRSAHRLPDVDAYLTELWRLGARLGYDPAAAAAQSSYATAGWTSDAWREHLNPAAIGAAHADPLGIRFSTAIDAARGHLVHLSAHGRGYDPRLQTFIALDPRWQSVFEAGVAGRARVLADLGAAWHADPSFAGQVAAHFAGIQSVIQEPRPESGGARVDSRPPALARAATGNWRERRFDQQPVAVVFHLADRLDLTRTVAWYANPVSRTSMHIVVDRDGGITQLVNSCRAAWAADDVKNPRRDIPWLSAALAQCTAAGGPMSFDDFTLSAAYIGTPSEAPTDAQYRGLTAMAAYWRDRFQIAPKRGRLLRHSDINSVDRVHCPGQQFDLDRVIVSLGGDPDDRS